MPEDEKTEETPEEVTSGDTVEETSSVPPTQDEAPQPEPVAPAPVSSDPLGDEKPTNPLVLIGAAVAVILLLVVIISSVTGGSPYDTPGVSPELNEGDEKEWKKGVTAAGESYVRFLEKKRWNKEVAEIGYEEERMANFSKRVNFYQDEKEALKENKRMENGLEFFKKHKDDLENDKAEPVDVTTEEQGGHKVYRCTVKGKTMVPSGDEGWKLEDRSKKYTLRFAWINEEWRLVGKN